MGFTSPGFYRNHFKFTGIELPFQSIQKGMDAWQAPQPIPVRFTNSTLLLNSDNATGFSYISFNIQSGAFCPIRSVAAGW